MTELSPQAKAVLNAAYRRMDENPHKEVEATLAAALRAAADCLWVDKPDGANSVYETHRAQLLAIATELETQ